MEHFLCSIAEAANALGVGRSKLYELLADEKLESVTIGRRRLVRVESVRALALGHATRDPDPEELRSSAPANAVR
jgi:excisionase family DNA binding protein